MFDVLFLSSPLCFACSFSSLEAVRAYAVLTRTVSLAFKELRKPLKERLTGFKTMVAWDSDHSNIFKPMLRGNGHRPPPTPPGLPPPPLPDSSCLAPSSSSSGSNPGHHRTAEPPNPTGPTPRQHENPPVCRSRVQSRPSVQSHLPDRRVGGRRR